MSKSLIAREIAVAVAAGAVSLTVAAMDRERLRPFVALLTAGEAIGCGRSGGFGVGVLLLDETDATLWITLTYHNLAGAPSRTCIDVAPDEVGAEAALEFPMAPAPDGELAATSRPLTPRELHALTTGSAHLSVRTSADALGEILGRILPAPTPRGALANPSYSPDAQRRPSA